MSTLVYLHIPKAAGTSHRQYLAQVYGEDAIFWYGLNSDAGKFNPKELASAPVVGGHRPLEFFPKSFPAIYTSILRDPVERAVSFFNYCAAPPNAGTEQWKKEREAGLARWRSRGVDPESMINSIENCKQFREEISNLQCQYLSRHGANFSGVRKTLHEEDMVIGVFDQLHQFNGFFQSELAYPIENSRRANAGSAGYSARILAEPGLVELIRSLNVEDQRLYDFVRFEHGGLYAGVDSLSEARKRVPTLEKRSNLTATSAPFDWKGVNIYCKGILQIATGKVTRVPLVIRNESRQNLIFSKEENGNSAIGWQFKDNEGKNIEKIQGIAHIEQVIPPGESKCVVVGLTLDHDPLHNEFPRSVEFSIVENNRWVREEHPLNSSWAILYAEQPEN
ncbi:MAG: sulfotransferase family 2 domain-containing protein [Halioglobus sp.]